IHTGIASQFVAPHLVEFLDAYPQMKLQIIGDDNHLDVNIREADVLIRPWVPAESDLIQKHLFSFETGLYASKAYIAKYGIPKIPEDLQHHLLIASAVNHLAPISHVN